MEQGTPEWLEWRRQGIGASESAALLGVCPYNTAYSLWLEKTSGQTADKSESASIFQRGHETEAMVRASYEFQTGLEFAPALFEHPEYPFIRASLDGWNDAERKGIEIKYMGAEKFDGPIPQHHIIQVQHQMLVTATDSWTYLRHNGGRTKVEILSASPNIQRDILAACWQFWEQVQTRQAPAYGPKDWVPSDEPKLLEALDRMRAATTTADRTFHRLEVLRLVRHPRTLAGTAKITTNPPRVTL